MREKNWTFSLGAALTRILPVLIKKRAYKGECMKNNILIKKKSVNLVDHHDGLRLTYNKAFLYNTNRNKVKFHLQRIYHKEM